LFEQSQEAGMAAVGIEKRRVLDKKDCPVPLIIKDQQRFKHQIHFADCRVVKRGTASTGQFLSPFVSKLAITGLMISNSECCDT
jgi:hypothetical protein